jgi:AcrR family transcriptional regulator
MVRIKKEERRSQFLAAALKLFAANGVQGTTTAAISEEAGTAAGTLFLYFPTKQDLINQLVMHIGRAQSDYIKSCLDPSLSVRETFFAIWQGSIRWFLENPDAYLVDQQVRYGGLVDQTIVQESAHLFEYFYSAIQRGNEERAIKPYPVEIIGGILYQDIVAILNLIKAKPEKEEQVEYIRAGFEIFWDGVRYVEP